MCDLQGPRSVVNLQTVGAPSTVVVIQAITLRQEVLDRACRRGEGRTSRFVDGIELRTTAVSPHTPIVDGGLTPVDAHGRGIVRQVE